MAFGTRSRRRPAGNTVVTTTTTSRPVKPSLMTRLRGGHKTHHHHHNHGTTTTTAARPARRSRFSRTHRAEPVHHQRRKTSIGDKVSGAMLKLRGSLTRRPGLKAAGTRRMHGTDGRGARRYY